MKLHIANNMHTLRKPLQWNKKGQNALIVGIVVVFVAVIITSILVPILNPFLDTAAANATARGDAGQALLINLIPLLFWVILVLALLAVQQIGREAV